MTSELVFFSECPISSAAVNAVSRNWDGNGSSHCLSACPYSLSLQVSLHHCHLTKPQNRPCHHPSAVCERTSKAERTIYRHSYIYHPELTNINCLFFHICFKSFVQVNQICPFLPPILAQVSGHSSCPCVIIIPRIYIIGMPADIRVLFPGHFSKVNITIKWVPHVFWFPQGWNLCVCEGIADSLCCTAQSNTTLDCRYTPSIKKAYLFFLNLGAI